MKKKEKRERMRATTSNYFKVVYLFLKKNICTEKQNKTKKNFDKKSWISEYHKKK